MENQQGQQRQDEMQPAVPSGELEGKVALVIGGLADNGRSLATELAAQGADVAYMYHPAQQQTAEEMAAAISNKNQTILLLPAETFDRKKIRELMHHIQHRFGHLDIFIDNSQQAWDLERFSENGDDE